MVRIKCEQCKIEGLLQKVGKHYFRIRHYDGMNPNTHKPKFHYHQNSKDYVLKTLTDSGVLKENMTIDQVFMTKRNIDPEKSKAPSVKRMAGGVGFEPTTTSLGGLRPVHARLPAHPVFSEIDGDLKSFRSI